MAPPIGDAPGHVGDERVRAATRRQHAAATAAIARRSPRCRRRGETHYGQQPAHHDRARDHRGGTAYATPETDGAVAAADEAPLARPHERLTVPRFFVPQRDLEDGKARLQGGEFRHMQRVLRLREGDAVTLFADAGVEHEGVIVSMSPRVATVRITASAASARESPLALTLYQGVPKGRKMDLVVEKATARDPQERFQTAREMVAAIEKVVTPAPARQVGQWVQLLAKEALAKRASLLEAIQAVPPAEPRPDARRAQAPIADSAPAPARSTSETPPPVPQPSTPPPPGPSAPGLSATVAAHAGRDPGAPPRRGWLVPVALGALVLFGGGAAAARFAPRPWAAATAPTAAAVELPPPAPTPTVDSPKPPDLHPPASAAATAAEVAGPVTTAPATSGIVRAWGRGRPRTGASASPRASATADALEMDKRK